MIWERQVRSKLHRALYAITMAFGLEQHISTGTHRFNKVKNVLWEFKLHGISPLSPKTELIFFLNKSAVILIFHAGTTIPAAISIRNLRSCLDVPFFLSS